MQMAKSRISVTTKTSEQAMKSEHYVYAFSETRGYTNE